MRRASATVWAPVMTSVLLLSALGCSRTTEQATPVLGDMPVASPASLEFADDLRRRVTVDAMKVHLTKFQEIADAHGGNRASGTPGYDASVDYVVGTLRDAGFDVQTPEFEVRVFSADKPTLSVGGKEVDVDALKYTLATPAEGSPRHSWSCRPVTRRGVFPPAMTAWRSRARWCSSTGAAAPSTSSRPSPPRSARRPWWSPTTSTRTSCREPWVRTPT